MIRSILLGAMLAFAPAAANAVTYNAVADFAANNPNGVWRYGAPNASNTALDLFTSYSASCFGQTGFGCYLSGDYQGVGLSTNGGAVNPPGLGTVSIPNNVLWMHPADGAGSNKVTTVQFIAPTTGNYDVSGYFQRLTDAAHDGSGNGVTLGIFRDNFAVMSSPALEGTPAAATQQAFDFRIALNAGQALSFNVYNNGDYFYDSTGLALTINSGAVPEPAQWALLIAGFGLVGGVSRRRRSNTVFA